MKLENFTPFIGEHCETTATGSILQHIGLNLSEPMLFGLGQGLSFIYWKMKTMPFPFFGGRIKADEITKNICFNLNLKLEMKETTSLKKAWKNAIEALEDNKPVGIKLDCYHLEYFIKKVHFAAHYVCMHGYDDENVFVVDTKPQGSAAKTSHKNFALARNEKGPMSSRNLSYTIDLTPNTKKPQDVILNAIKANAINYLNPPIKNIGFRGIEKASKEIYKWFNTSKDITTEFEVCGRLMEVAGTGGALFRNLYRDFLKESYELLKLDFLHKAYQDFIEIAKLWNQVSKLFDDVSKTKDIKYLDKASETLKNIAQKEKVVMEYLLENIK
ncbi:MAG: BtrH N-terminal domain-containing protein [Hyphomicrobiales bacterium]